MSSDASVRRCRPATTGKAASLLWKSAGFARVPSQTVSARAASFPFVSLQTNPFDSPLSVPTATDTASRPTFLGADRRVIALGLARMADALGNSFLIIVLPLYVASQQVEGGSLGLPASVITGIVLALFGIVSSFTQPFAGHLSDKFGKRRFFVLLGLVIFCVANFSFSLAHSYPILFLIRAIQGAAAAFTITASVALVSELSTLGKRGQNMGLYNSFRLVGFGGGPLLAGVVMEAGPYAIGSVVIDGFEASFYLAALAAFVSAALVALLVRDPEETQPTRRNLELRIRGRGPDQTLDPIFTLGVATLLMTSCIALLSPIEPEVNARLDQGPFLFSIQFAAFIGAMAAVQPIVGHLSDDYGRRGFIVWGLIALAPTTLAQGLVITPMQMIAVRLLQGVAGAMMLAPALALAGDLAEDGQVGAKLSILTVAFGLGISAGQIASGILVHYGFVVPFAAGSVLALGGAALVVTQVREPEPTRRAAGGYE